MLAGWFALLKAISITGTGFSRIAAENQVYLGSTPCQKVTTVQYSTTDNTATKLSCGVPIDTVAGLRKASNAFHSACVACIVVQARLDSKPNVASPFLDLGQQLHYMAIAGHTSVQEQCAGLHLRFVLSAGDCQCCQQGQRPRQPDGVAGHLVPHQLVAWWSCNGC